MAARACEPEEIPEELERDACHACVFTGKQGTAQGGHDGETDYHDGWDRRVADCAIFPPHQTERKTLVVAGAAAGMSAPFASPVAAVLLAIELLLFEWKPWSMIPVALDVAPDGPRNCPRVR